jgi:hypothetical protein
MVFKVNRWVKNIIKVNRNSRIDFKVNRYQKSIQNISIVRTFLDIYLLLQFLLPALKSPSPVIWPTQIPYGLELSFISRVRTETLGTKLGPIPHDRAIQTCTSLSFHADKGPTYSPSAMKALFLPSHPLIHPSFILLFRPFPPYIRETPLFGLVVPVLREA